MGVLAELGVSFVIGLLTPLTAACVLPLYPGFLSYLATQFTGEEDRRTYALVGAAVVAGVITFMLLVGILFTTILQVSLTGVTTTVGPAAFALLGLVGIGLLLDVDAERAVPSIQPPSLGSPLRDAYGFGFVFGVLVLPCNPGFIAAFFARSLGFIETPLLNIGSFLAFGLGIGAPLLGFSLVSMQYSRAVIGTVTRYRTGINRVSGAVMVAVALYYLVAVFRVLGPGPAAAMEGFVAPIFTPFYAIASGLLP
ncbi:MAG: cytochrome C biogenesis protein [Candidatus Nanohaloarchaea archaeon]|nr:cytochrome C biogenesis protein [Candidatus Nanohaloarchaea archaeon]